MSVAADLQKRLQRYCRLPVELPKRTYAGKQQLRGWAPSWEAQVTGGLQHFASIYTMTEIVKAKRMHLRRSGIALMVWPNRERVRKVRT